MNPTDEMIDAADYRPSEAFACDHEQCDVCGGDMCVGRSSQPTVNGWVWCDASQDVQALEDDGDLSCNEYRWNKARTERTVVPCPGPHRTLMLGDYV